jgi:hypothetical protein
MKHEVHGVKINRTVKEIAESTVLIRDFISPVSEWTDSAGGKSVKTKLTQHHHQLTRYNWHPLLLLSKKAH